MKTHLLLAALLAGQAGLAGASPAETHVDVTRRHGAQEAVVLEREFPVGGESGWHVHPGIEIGHVVSGVTEMRTATGEARRYGPGETFVVPRGVVHNGVNVGDVPARLVITYVIDKDAPLRRSVPAP